MPVVFAVPWLVMLLALPILLSRRLRVTSFRAPVRDAPLVSVIVPARNEAVNISACVASLLDSVYPEVEIIVVDDGSVDGTGDIVQILAQHARGRLTVIDGKPLPAGWLGKPWACWQGYQQARGEVLLFTDADTRHDDALLGHAVGALQRQQADLVSVLPRQLMIGFWERLVLPHIFAVLSMRFHDLKRVNRTRNPRDVIANGQFMLFRRSAYEAIGGHESVRGDVVEDLALAQHIVQARLKLFVAHAHDIMDTRMYRSLGGIVEGWSKNLALGSRRAAPAWIAPAVPWLIALYLLILWVTPPAVLLVGLLTPVSVAALSSWAVAATTLSLGFWAGMLIWMRVPVVYAVGYPVGAGIAAVLFVRSAVRGARVEWKGREYEIGPPGPAPGWRP
jgi:chlorobactene glucosyltransferase